MIKIGRKGVKIEVKEELKQENYEIKKMKSPERVYIPLIQHVGEPASATVEEGDYVKKGEKIGESEVFISSYIHSSISGEVKEIKEISHPEFKKVKGIVIENDYKEKKDSSILKEKKDIRDISHSEIINNIRNAGIVGMGGACFPTHVKLSPPEGKTIDSYILNAAECEPLLTNDSSLILRNALAIILGMKLAMKAVGVKKGYVGVEKNNLEAAEAMNHAIKELKEEVWEADIKVHHLPTSYPQGAEKQIIKTILEKEVPPGGLPYEVNTIVNNVATCFSIYEAVVYNKPLYERVITVTGDGVRKPLNLLVPIGTTVKQILDYCNINMDIEKLILGGPMMGKTQYDLNTPIIKGTSGIVLLTGFKKEDKEINCIKCGRCVDVCPVNLIPTRLAQLVKKDLWGKLEEYNIKDCIECGCCSYICPSNIPLVHLIKLGKSKK